MTTQNIDNETAAQGQNVREPYALQATMNQLIRWINEGNDSIYFGALSDHPETNDESTFGDLIPQAFEQYEALVAQRDELLAALRKIAEREWEGENKTWRTEAIEMQDEALAAIAKAEGK